MTIATSPQDAASPAYKPLVSLVIPAFNEQDLVRENMTTLIKTMEGLEGEYRWELILIDDGSSDETAAEAEQAAAGRGNVHILNHPFNFRMGQALRTGFRMSKGDIVIVLDVDLSFGPEHIKPMLDKMKSSRAKIVIASPYRKGGRSTRVPRFRHILSVWANRFLCRMATRDFFSDRLTSITTMARAYDGPFIRALSLWAMDVDINSEIINKAKLLRARIVEIPAHLDWTIRRRGGTRFRGRRSSTRIIRGIVQSLVSGFMFRPFMFYLAPGFFLFFLSWYPLIWAAVHSLRQYAQLGAQSLTWDDRLSQAVGLAFKISPHSFLVGGILLLIAIQFISLGLLALQKKRYFVELFYITSLIYQECVLGKLPKPFGSDPCSLG